MSLERLGREIQHELSPFITAESTLHGIEVPNIEFIDEIVSSFTKVPFNGLYNWNTNTIILNYNQLRRLLDIGTTEEEAKLNMIETGFHEFKHHIDATKFNMTPKVYSGNKHKWERRACRYAAGMMGKYNLRAGWDESFGEGKFRVLKAQWNHGNPGTPKSEDVNILKKRIEMLKHYIQVTIADPYRREHGKVFIGSVGGENRLLTKRGAFCYENAKNMYFQLKRKGLAPNYYEGFAQDEDGLIVAHAWVVVDGKVIDDTWGVGSYNYIGLPIKEEYLRKSEDFVLSKYPAIKVVDKSEME